MSNNTIQEGLIEDLDEVGHDEIPTFGNVSVPPPLPSEEIRHPARDSQVMLSKDEEELVKEIERNQAILKKMREDRERMDFARDDEGGKRFPPQNENNVPPINNIIKNPHISVASGSKPVAKRLAVSRLKKAGMILKPLVIWPVVGVIAMAAAPVVLGSAVSAVTGMSLLSAAGTVAVYSSSAFSLVGIGIGVAGIAKSYAVFKTPRDMLQQIENDKIFRKNNKKPGLIDKGISATAGAATYLVSKSFQLSLKGLKEGFKLTAKGVSKGFVTLEERNRIKKANKQNQAPTIVNPNQGPKP